MRRYREERKPAVRKKNTMCLQTIQSEGSAVHFGIQSLYNRSLRGHTNKRESQGRAWIRRTNEE